MTTEEVSELSAEFRRLSEAARAAGDSHTAGTWQLAAAKLNAAEMRSLCGKAALLTAAASAAEN